MGLTEVPSELFRMNNVKRLYLPNNKLCSLPSEISHLPNLNVLTVRLSKRLVGSYHCRVVFRSTATSSRLFRPSSFC